LDSNGLYKDPSFPATIEVMMYWKSIEKNTPDFAKTIGVIEEKYGGINFLRPSEIPEKNGGSKTPSLWGSKGI